MGETALRVDEVERLARRALDSDELRAEHHPGGFGNENWRLHDAAGCRFMLKVGDPANEAKWRSSHVAHELAESVGVPVPALVHLAESAGHLVRIFTWIEGDSATQVTAGSQRSVRLMRSVGSAVRDLHSVALDGFSSRLDRSAPSFSAWQGYIKHRLQQIRRRCAATGAVDDGLLNRACGTAAALAEEVSDSAEAVLCHRDLHPDNLIVDAEGELVGIIDWDAAEAWDAAGDWFKLEFDLLRAHPEGEEILLTAYLDGAGVPSEWEQRRRLVHIIEALNTLPNAVSQSWSTDFSDRAEAHLVGLLSRSDRTTPAGLDPTPRSPS